MYAVINPYTQEIFDFLDENLAKQKEDEILAEMFEKEDYRFTVIKETVTGNDTIWTNADFQNDNEIGVYHVFNQGTGLHEKYTSLKDAIQRKTELKTLFISETNLKISREFTLP
jgi:hypothetical protein